MGHSSSGEGYNVATAITSDHEGFIYVTGRYEGPLSINEYTLTSSAYPSAFILKINEAGEIQWVKSLPEPWHGFALSIVVDPENDIYIGGSFFSSSFPTKYTMKFNNNGELLWATGNHGFGCKSLAIDDDSNIYAIGALNGRARIGFHDYYTDSIYIGTYESQYWITDADILAVN